MKRRRRKGSDSEGGKEESSEELAKARRDRARKARADLAAKAQADADATPEEKAEAAKKRADEPTAAGKRAEERAKARERLARSSAAKRSGGESEGDEDEEKAADRRKSEKREKRERRERRERPRATAKTRSKGSREKSKASGDKRKRGAGAKKAGRGTLVALKQGAGETRKRAKAAAPKAANGALKILAAGFTIFFAGFGFVLRALIAGYRAVAPPVRAGLRIANRTIEAISRQVTPVRVLALVVAGAAVLLALSQFADYRNISIGNDAYADGIQTVAPAPVRETADTGSAHSYLMVPLAGVALILLGAAMTGRWRLCRLIALAGLIAIAVGLIHDRPTGLDVGDEALAYTGVKATLLGGFYAQLFSGLLLTLASLLLGRELRLAGARRPARASRGSRARRKLLKRNPRVEGARA